MLTRYVRDQIGIARKSGMPKACGGASTTDLYACVLKQIFPVATGMIAKTKLSATEFPWSVRHGHPTR